MLTLDFFFRRRTLVAIGTHDLDTLRGPFTYEVGLVDGHSSLYAIYFLGDLVMFNWSKRETVAEGMWAANVFSYVHLSLEGRGNFQPQGKFFVDLPFLWSFNT